MQLPRQSIQRLSPGLLFEDEEVIFPRETPSQSRSESPNLAPRCSGAMFSVIPDPPASALPARRYPRPRIRSKTKDSNRHCR